MLKYEEIQEFVLQELSFSCSVSLIQVVLCRAAKTTLEAEIVTKQLIPLSQISKMKSTHMTFGLHLHRFCLLCVLQEN
eukprot:05092.XXX_150762_150995_1 [CDS] Oithona nana genome sequencing.